MRTKTHTHISPFLSNVPHTLSARTPARALRQQEKKGSVTERGEIFPHTRCEREISPSEGTFFYPGLFASLFSRLQRRQQLMTGRFVVCLFRGRLLCVCWSEIFIVCEELAWPLLSEGAQQQGRLITILAAAELLFI
jgi:hypothetical protein